MTLAHASFFAHLLRVLGTLALTPAFHNLLDMSIQHRFPDVHWIWGGGISYVYEVHPRIVVKVPRLGDSEGEQFQIETKIYEISSRNSPYPSIVQCSIAQTTGYSSSICAVRPPKLVFKEAFYILCHKTGRFFLEYRVTTSETSRLRSSLKLRNWNPYPYERNG